jgi:diadenosine tetraphosphate (Ap4A) HIT family hydrolase
VPSKLPQRWRGDLRFHDDVSVEEHDAPISDDELTWSRLSWREDRIGSARRGENPMVMARMRSGFAVIGDTQHLPGYSLLLSNAAADHLTDLPWARRAEFLFDLSLIGEAITSACADHGLLRVNYEVLGNAEPWLHGHVHPRYAWEPAERITWPVWTYPPHERNAPKHRYDDATHGQLRSRIAREIERLTSRAYKRRL